MTAHLRRWGVCVAVILLQAGCGKPESTVETPPAAPAEAPVTAHSVAAEQPDAVKAADPSKLVGRWLRPDGGYVLELSAPTADRLLKAAYFNPQRINVARAEWKHEEGYLGVFIELRDVNYPGSTYTLAYDAPNDRLVGIYYHAALKLQFDVQFERTQ